MRHFLYKLDDSGGRVGMVSIPDDSMMSRVPEGSVEVGETPVLEDKSGHFFEAWRLGEDGSVTVDLEKAKEIKLGQLRRRRDELFKALDQSQFQSYCSKKDEVLTEIETEKQVLRDFPERIDWDSVETLHDIAHIMPPELV
tara:strand:- start:566 stop:988 length:423 start_codon:yes stop_codon:yes gene_type:complete